MPRLDDRAPMTWGAPLPCLLGEASSSSWVEVVRSGTFYGNSGPKPRRVELSADDIAAMAANWATVKAEEWFTGGAPVGYNHASAFGAVDPESTKAAARILDVEVRANDRGGMSLWGLFEWTDEGARRVSAGEFAAVSAELLPPSSATSKLTGEKLGSYVLVGATLTNAPFIPGMTAPQVSDMVAASEAIYLTEFREPDIMADERNPTMTALTELVSKPEGELLSEIKRLQAEAAKAATLGEALETATTDLEAFRERTTALEDREKTRVLDAACSTGRIAPTERDDYWSVLQTLGEDKANRLFAEGRLPTTREAAPTEAIEADAVAPHDGFLSMLDSARTEGLSEAEAWDRARVQLGGNLYSQEN